MLSMPSMHLVLVLVVAVDCLLGVYLLCDRAIAVTTAISSCYVYYVPAAWCWKVVSNVCFIRRLCFVPTYPKLPFEIVT